MKLFIVLFAVVAAASAFPGYEGWNPWRSSAWQDPWQSNAWNAWNPWNPWQQNHHHGAEHVHVHQVAQPHPIPPLHPKPLHLKVHDEAVKLHYDYPHIHHPKLIGYEVLHHKEPEIHKVHGHGGHSW